MEGRINRKPAEPGVYKEAPPSILAAAMHADTLAVGACLKLGQDINTRDQEGATPLFLASAAGFTNTARFLINKGADINAQDEAGYTPLMMATRYGHRKIAEMLLAAGADVCLQTYAIGYTALVLAGLYVQIEIGEMIEQAGGMECGK